MRLWACLIGLSACMGKERFDEKYADEVCLLFAECEVLDLEGYSTARSCRQDVGQHTDTCGDFDTSNAKECIQKVRSSSCEDIQQGGLPLICDRVCSD